MDDLVTWLRARLDDEERSVEDDVLPSGEAAWVLAEVDAKRRILDEHRDSGGTCRTCCGEAYLEETWDGEQERATWKRADKPFPCPTVRLLALPFADRPGYREEWKP